MIEDNNVYKEAEVESIIFCLRYKILKAGKRINA